MAAPAAAFPAAPFKSGIIAGNHGQNADFALDKPAESNYNI